MNSCIGSLQKLLILCIIRIYQHNNKAIKVFWMTVLDINKMQWGKCIHFTFMLLSNILDNIVVRVNQHKKGKRANKWLYQNANNIIAGTTGKKTQSGI